LGSDYNRDINNEDYSPICPAEGFFTVSETEDICVEEILIFIGNNFAKQLHFKKKYAKKKGSNILQTYWRATLKSFILLEKSNKTP
jgi:hypothetical protein